MCASHLVVGFVACTCPLTPVRSCPLTPVRSCPTSWVWSLGCPQVLIKRHSDLVILYNAQSDSTRPKTMAVCAAEIMRREEVANKKSRAADTMLDWHKGTAPDEVRRKQQLYLLKNKAHFKELTEQARATHEVRKKEKAAAMPTEPQAERGRRSEHEDKACNEGSGSETEGEPEAEPMAEDLPESTGGSRPRDTAPTQNGNCAAACDAGETTNGTVAATSAAAAVAADSAAAAAPVSPPRQPAEAYALPSLGRSGTRSLSLKKRRRASFVDSAEVAADDALSQELL